MKTYAKTSIKGVFVAILIMVIVAVLSICGIKAYANENAVIKDGTYYIGNANNFNQVLDVSGGSGDNGANVQLYGINQSTAQRWTIENQLDGTVMIRNGSGKYLDVAGGIAANGSNVWQYTGNKTEAQKWYITQYGDTYKITSALSSSYVIDIAGGSTSNGTNVQIYADNGSNAQRFFFFALNPNVPASTETSLDGKYAIQSSKNNNYFVDVAGCSSDDGANIQLYNGKAGENEAQIFNFKIDSKGYYTITNNKTGKAIDVAGGNIWPGANIWQYRSNGTNAQKWSISRNNDGTLTITNAATGLVMDISGGVIANGSNIQGYLSNGTNAQKWNLQSCESPRERLDKLASDNKNAVEDGTYYLFNLANNSLAMDIDGSSTIDGANVQFGNITKTASQQFKVSHDSTGYVTLKNVNSGKVVDVNNASAASGQNIQQYSSNGSWAQKWIAVPYGNGFKLISGLSENYMAGTKDSSPSDKSNICLVATTTSNNCLFKFTDVSKSEISVSLNSSKGTSGLSTESCIFTATVTGGSGNYQYRFAVDGTTKQAFSSSNTYTYNEGVVGTHTILCDAKDVNTFATATSTYSYTVKDATKANITFDFNGGSTKTGKLTFTTTYGKKYGDYAFDEPFKSGYTFQYWSADGSTGSAIDPTATIPNEVTLTAVYAAAKTSQQYWNDLNMQQVGGTSGIWEASYDYVDYGNFLKNYSSDAEAFSQYPEDTACSSVRYGNYYGRNLDGPRAYKDSLKQIVVHTAAANGRHATMGISHIWMSTPSVSTVSFLKIAPFYLYDGVNDQGVACSSNAICIDQRGYTKGTDSSHTKADNTGDICSAMLVRYVLDYADSVDDAIQLLSSKNIYSTVLTSAYKEFHFMISDAAGNNALIEFVYNGSDTTAAVEKEMKVIRFNQKQATPGSASTPTQFKGIMTNFLHYYWDGTADSFKSDRNNFKHPWGIERHDILNNALYGDGAVAPASLSDMLNVMKKVWCSQMYDKNIYDSEFDTKFWLSDFFTSTWTINTERTKTAFAGNPYIANLTYTPSTNSADFTLHSAVYDLVNGTMSVIRGESGTAYNFNINRN